MATRIPLVMGSNGLPQQLQAGDTLNSPSSTTSVRQLTSAESSFTLTSGMVVYVSGAGLCKRAEANAIATSSAIGLVSDATIAAGATGNIADGGVLSIATAAWDAVAGTTGGLTPGTLYFLSPTTAGFLTATPPSTVGQVALPVGQAMSSTDLRILTALPILL